MKLKINGELMDYNKLINVTRANKYGGAGLKKAETEKVVWACKANKIKPIEGLHDYEINWYCKDKRKDKDNISSAVKFILDGLQEAGVIKNDGWKEIGNIYHNFYVDKDNPRIEVVATKVENNG